MMVFKLKEIDPTTLRQWMQEGKVILIDVREEEENKAERIPEAHLFPLSSFDPQKLPNSEGKTVVFHCRSGGRSSRAAEKWASSKNVEEAYHLKGGITAWKNEGFPVIQENGTSFTLFFRILVGVGIAILAYVFWSLFMDEF